MLGSRKVMRLVALVGTLLALSLVPATARADAVPPPPTDCLDGTMGTTCHGGPYCQPYPCKTNADCTGGRVCQPRAFCLRQVTCGGGIVLPDGGPASVPEPAAGPACSSPADCDGGAMCTTENLCVTPGSTGPSGGTAVVQGCSCEAAGGGGPLVLSVIMLVAGGAGALARWSRRPARRHPRSTRSAE